MTTYEFNNTKSNIIKELENEILYEKILKAQSLKALSKYINVTLPTKDQIINLIDSGILLKKILEIDNYDDLIQILNPNYWCLDSSDDTEEEEEENYVVEHKIIKVLSIITEHFAKYDSKDEKEKDNAKIDKMIENRKMFDECNENQRLEIAKRKFEKEMNSGVILTKLNRISNNDINQITKYFNLNDDNIFFVDTVEIVKGNILKDIKSQKMYKFVTEAKSFSDLDLILNSNHWIPLKSNFFTFTL